MKILSIDVGIKNLALCLFEKKPDLQEFSILKWDVINLADKETHTCCEVNKTKHCTTPCRSPAKYQRENQCFCIKHAKKGPFLVPSKELKPSLLKKHTIATLVKIATSYGIDYDIPAKKTELISKITDFYNEKCLHEIVTENASKIELSKVAGNIKTKLNDLFADIDKIEHVIIENQISTIASRMKTVQGMIVQYFVMSHICVDKIAFVNARNKLKEVFKESGSEKSSYAERKKLSITKCLEIISTKSIFTEQLDFFNAHKKKDDLADTFLQGQWFIKEHQL
jgi:hypothetical protein